MLNIACLLMPGSRDFDQLLGCGGLFNFYKDRYFHKTFHFVFVNSIESGFLIPFAHGKTTTNYASKKHSVR